MAALWKSNQDFCFAGLWIIVIIEPSLIFVHYGGFYHTS
jgi:hypothetical protein